jgi:hypothetical protein
MARTGKGIRLRSNINIKGDMGYLLLSCVIMLSCEIMTSGSAMPGPEKYLQRGGVEVVD